MPTTELPFASVFEVVITARLGPTSDDREVAFPWLRGSYFRMHLASLGIGTLIPGPSQRNH